MAFKPVSDNQKTYAKFEDKGDSITGYYLGSYVDEGGKYGPKTNFIFQVGDNEKTIVSGTTFITNRMESILPGVMTRITFTGTEKGKNGNKFKSFLIEVDEDDTIEVAASVAAPIARKSTSAANLADKAVG